MLLFANASPMPAFWRKLAETPSAAVITLLALVCILLAVRKWGERFKS